MKASSEFALYHQAKREPVRLEILKVHSDGTVDLGREGAVIVSQCQVVKEPQPGCCTPEPKPKASKAPTAPAQQQIQAPQGEGAPGSSESSESSGDEKTSSDSDAPVGARPPVK